MNDRVYGPVCLMTGGLRKTGLQVHVAERSRFQLNTTAAALNGVPSENVTPWRRVMFTVLPPLAYE